MPSQRTPSRSCARVKLYISWLPMVKSQGRHEAPSRTRSTAASAARPTLSGRGASASRSNAFLWSMMSPLWSRNANGDSACCALKKSTARRAVSSAPRYRRHCVPLKLPTSSTSAYWMSAMRPQRNCAVVCAAFGGVSGDIRTRRSHVRWPRSRDELGCSLWRWAETARLLNATVREISREVCCFRGCGHPSELATMAVCDTKKGAGDGWPSPGWPCRSNASFDTGPGTDVG
mmetsp:Transcript_43225/g.109426  ORF Transcript_43225/g.109426 Transcript_43225/m.109426 type:complete len:232 (+) Transcript_43225:431-1126(+)